MVPRLLALEVDHRGIERTRTEIFLVALPPKRRLVVFLRYWSVGIIRAAGFDA